MDAAVLGSREPLGGNIVNVTAAVPQQPASSGAAQFAHLEPLSLPVLPPRGADAVSGCFAHLAPLQPLSPSPLSGSPMAISPASSPVFFMPQGMVRSPGPLGSPVHHAPAAPKAKVNQIRRL